MKDMWPLFVLFGAFGLVLMLRPRTAAAARVGEGAAAGEGFWTVDQNGASAWVASEDPYASAHLSSRQDKEEANAAAIAIAQANANAAAAAAAGRKKWWQI